MLLLLDFGISAFLTTILYSLLSAAPLLFYTLTPPDRPSDSYIAFLISDAILISKNSFGFFEYYF